MARQEQWIKIPIAEGMKARARARDLRDPPFKGSYTEGEGRYHGYLGEAVFQEFRPYAKHADHFDYDFVSQGKRIDVKTFSFNSLASEMEWIVPQTHCTPQKCDFLAVVILHNSDEHAYLVGYIEFDLFLDMSQWVFPGDPMPQGGKYKVHGLKIISSQLKAWR
jgi:hypothetical protein